MNYFNKDINFNSSKDSLNKIPDSPGIYMLCLKDGISLPSTDISPIYNRFHGLDIVYNGITVKSSSLFISGRSTYFSLIFPKNIL